MRYAPPALARRLFGADPGQHGDFDHGLDRSMHHRRALLVSVGDSEIFSRRGSFWPAGFLQFRREFGLPHLTMRGTTLESAGPWPAHRLRHMPCLVFVSLHLAARGEGAVPFRARW